MNDIEIHVNGRSYMIKRLEQETDQVLSTRLWFIIKQGPENEIDFLEAERLSKVWYYMKYYGCRYSQELETRVDCLSKLLYE